MYHPLDQLKLNYIVHTHDEIGFIFGITFLPPLLLYFQLFHLLGSIKWSHPPSYDGGHSE